MCVLAGILGRAVVILISAYSSIMKTFRPNKQQTEEMKKNDL